ncbi:hypothetical protein BGW38_008376 [Lunasporangiospora selenospora]|uniref:Uncharacterized protein n=1 Tax=Lunasporangiospora selenospora TaxID=979761 RepID=A0A9P6FYN7_9FUNG|nr:hypothetical protein BGW38_008376 [Lunasporangiospora selenospora]
MDANIDTLEVLLNPTLIKSKINALPPDQAYAQGRRLLQDLLSIARFGVPTIVPNEVSLGLDEKGLGNDDYGVQQQTMQLSERQDMLLGHACKVYFASSLSLEDILTQVPAPNQLCLITAMMLLSQKLNSDAVPYIDKQEPWDPLTLLQRWIVRSRVSGADVSGLDFGDNRYHVQALMDKLSLLKDIKSQKQTSERIKSLECQLSSELGQYFCWSEEYIVAIPFLNQCQEVHRQHSTSGAPHLSCHLDLNRTKALLKLARLALGESLLDPKENLLNRVKTLETEYRHKELLDEFLKDNITRVLPFTWRQRIMMIVLERSDIVNGVLLAVANAFYRLGVPSEMLCEIPKHALQYLRSIPFESGDETDVYLTPGIFDDIMEIVSAVLKKQALEPSRNKVKAFASKLCATIQHVLCYEAAWKAGVLDLLPSDWNRVWDMYSFVLSQQSPEPIAEDPEKETREAEAMSQLLERMDPDDLEQYIRSLILTDYFAMTSFQKSMPHLTSCLVALAMGAQCCNRGKYIDGLKLIQSSARFLSQEKDTASQNYSRISYQLEMYTIIAQLGVLAQEIEQRREQRVQDRLEARFKSSGSSARDAASTPLQDSHQMDIDNPQDMSRQDASAAKREDLERDEIITNEIKICQVYGVLVPLCAILERGQILGVDLKDTAASSCLDALFSLDLDPINITRLAALDMIQGLMIKVGRPNRGSMQNQQPNNISRQRSKRQLKLENVHANGGGLEEDPGHAMILKLFTFVRIRGVVDVFAALLAGAVSSILPEQSKFTLSEFGYYALFTTSMDSVSSWSDPRVKIIAMLSNGDAGAAIDGTPMARQRFMRLLIHVHENQIQYDSEVFAKRIKIESEVKRQMESKEQSARQSVDSPASSSIPESAQSPYAALLQTITTPFSNTTLLSAKPCTRIARFSLCLTDLYHLEGLHREALASFLNACMISSGCFSDQSSLERRIWSAYTHGPIASHSPVPISSQAQTIVLPSQGGIMPGSGNIGGPQFPPGMAMPMPGPFGENGVAMVFPNAGGGPIPPFGGGVAPGNPVGLGLSPPLAPGQMPHDPPSTVFSPPPPPPPPPTPPTPPLAMSHPLQPPQSAAANGSPSTPVTVPSQALTPSTFALRAIDSCMQLNEPLAAAIMHQFLPRMDYNQAFAAIRTAHDNGHLSFNSSTPVFANLGPLPNFTAGGSGGSGGGGLAGQGQSQGQGQGQGQNQGQGGGPGGSIGGAQQPHPMSHLYFLLTSYTLRVQTSESVFAPHLYSLAGQEQLFEGLTYKERQRLISALSGTLPNGTLQPMGQRALVLPQVLDLVYDLSLLELISFLLKKEPEGQLKVQNRINSNRLALDLRQPFREQVHAMVQQDLLTRLWSRYAKSWKALDS